MTSTNQAAGGRHIREGAPSHPRGPWINISPVAPEQSYLTRRNAMSKSQDAKKNTKKEPTKTPKEKKEAKRLKKADKKH